MKKKLVFLLFPLAMILLLLPVMSNLTSYLTGDNDLGNFFYPMHLFIKKQIFDNHQIPLWYNSILSGTPLLPDPQSPLFYPINYLSIILPLNISFILNISFHILAASIGIYFIARKIFKLDVIPSIFAGIAYIFFPKLAAAIQAGHLGIIQSYSIIPWLSYAFLNLLSKPSLKKSFICSILLLLMFLTHLATFFFAFGLILVSFFIFLYDKKIRKIKENIKYLFYIIVIFIGISAFSSFPQFEWIPQTNRDYVKTIKQVFPIWSSKFEVIKNTLVPWYKGTENIKKTETEKVLALGLILSILSIFGYTKIKNRKKIFIPIFLIGFFALSANNASFFYRYLINQNWYLYLRVSSRIWLFSYLAISLLGAYGLQILLSKKGTKIISYLVAIIALGETFFISNAIVSNIKSQRKDLVSSRVYDFFADDKEIFRIYCTTNCFSASEVVFRNLEMINGYSTLIQKNFNNQALQLTGGFWNYYSLSILPFGLVNENLQPEAKALGEFNTKYVVSPYPLKDKNFKLISTIDNFKIYQNLLNLPRSKGEIKKYTPNYIKIDTSLTDKKPIILSQVFNSGWKAYLNGSYEYLVQQTPIGLTALEMHEDTNYIDLKYKPKTFINGLYVTLFTFLIVFFKLIFKRANGKKK